MRATRSVSGAWALGALLVGLTASTPSAGAAGFVGQSFPVAQRVDRQGRVRTALLLQFDVQRYGLTFEQFAAGKLDAHETAFRDFVLALEAGDAVKAATWRPGEPAKQTQALVTGYHKLFDGAQRMGVVARAGAGDAQVFIWDWPAPEGRRLFQAFSVEPARGGGLKVEITSSERPLETLVVDAVKQATLEPGEYAPSAAERARHYVFPLAAGRPGARPVRLRFDGEPVDVELTAPDAARLAAAAPPRVAAALRAYEAAWSAFEARDLERHLAAFTEGSRERLKGWFAEMKPEAFDAYHQDMMRGRRVRFVLDAAPLFLVFYTRGAEKRLYHDYVLDDGPRGAKLTNAYFEDYLDDVLGQSALWPADVEAFGKSLLGVVNPK
jgi:hypothetical protein